MQVTIASCSERRNRPIHCCDISYPQTILSEVRYRRAYPSPRRVGVSVGDHVVEASSTVHCKESDLQQYFDSNIIRSLRREQIKTLHGKNNHEKEKLYQDEFCAPNREVVESDILLEPEDRKTSNIDILFRFGFGNFVLGICQTTDLANRELTRRSRQSRSMFRTLKPSLLSCLLSKRLMYRNGAIEHRSKMNHEDRYLHSKRKDKFHEDHIEQINSEYYLNS